MSPFVAASRSPQPTRPPARQASLRSANLGLVLEHVCAAPSDAPPSRADIAQATGLTRSTVSRLMDELVEQGLVVELAPLADGQRGRPAVPLVPASGSCLGLGLQINVRHLAVRLVDLAGNVLGGRTADGDFAGADPRETVHRVAALGREVLADAPAEAVVAGARLALPGLVDSQHAVLLRAPNLGWWDVRPLGWLADSLGIPAAALGLGNEADFAAVTVSRTAPGRVKPDADFLFVSGEVGIGSALVTAGHVATGRHGWAGEIGHVCVDPLGPVCACGARGCLERYAGLTAICDAAGVPDREALAQALAAADPRAVGAAADAGRALGVVLAGALNLLDVSRVVLGGHLGAIADHLAPQVLDELRRRVIAAPFAEPALDRVLHDIDDAATGAAYVSLSGVLSDPGSWLEAPRTRLA